MQNGEYLTYPKIGPEQTWKFSSILSIFVFKCKISNKKFVINGSDIVNTSDKFGSFRMANKSHIPKSIVSKLGISVQLFGI